MSTDLKRQMLDLLKRDEDFRYAVLGLLGIGDVLNEISENTKAIKSLQEQVYEHTNAIKSLQEQVSENTKAIKSLQEQVYEHTKAIERLASRIDALGTRWGLVAEDAFRDSIKYLIEDLLKMYKVSKWTYYDNEGLVYGHPSIVEVDVLIKDHEHVLIEFKSYADKSDVSELYKVGQLYEKVNGIKPKMMIVAAVIRRRAKELADELGVFYRGDIMDY